VKALTTNAGFNAWAVLIPLNGLLTSMPDGPWRNILLALSYVSIMVIGWATKGSGLNMEEADEILDTTEELKDVLAEGRK